MSDFERELAAVINRYSQESRSNTPDFVLARFIAECLAAFNAATNARARFYDGSKEPDSRESCPACRLPPHKCTMHGDRWAKP